MSINNALTRFQRSLPDIYDLREFSEGLHSSEFHGDNVINPTLLLVHTAALLASIIIHQIQAENDPSEYATCLEAAREMARAARSIKSSSYLYAYVCLAVSQSCPSQLVIIFFILCACGSPHGTLVLKSWLGRSKGMTLLSTLTKHFGSVEHRKTWTEYFRASLCSSASILVAVCAIPPTIICDPFS